MCEWSVLAHLLLEDVDGGHHGGDVHAGCEGVQRDLLLFPGRPHALADLQQRQTWEGLKARDRSEQCGQK